ncbi:hypothetical protein CPB86DRAFT_788088 [Serendipita vermifera]|nr:hypothetical protein CPB86DRAFT_788088 [Serendipita vermifera]
MSQEESMESSIPTNDPNSSPGYPGAEVKREPSARQSRRPPGWGPPGVGQKPSVLPSPDTSKQYYTGGLGLGGQPLQSPGHSSSGREANNDEPPKRVLKLRLDLNLEIDVQIKAKIHGDVTLSLLD